MNNIPAPLWAAAGISTAVIAAAFVLVGGHHELIYQWRRRRRVRSIFVDLTHRGDPWR